MKEFFAKVYHTIRNWLKNASSVFTKKNIITLAAFVLAIAVLCVSTVLIVSLSIKKVTSERIITADEAKLLEDVDYIIILGAGLRPDGSPSDMLTDRLITGISLSDNDVPLLMSGDNSGEHYNEVGAMKEYALAAGVDVEKIVLDGEGYSTYESIIRAKEEWGAERVIIVTQGYHLHRALYIADQLGLDAYGVSADVRTYRGQLYRDAREHLARFKDFFQCLTEE